MPRAPRRHPGDLAQRHGASFFERQAQRLQITMDRGPPHHHSSGRQTIAQLLERQVRLGRYQVAHQLLMPGQGEGLVTAHRPRLNAASMLPTPHQLDRTALAHREPAGCRSPRQATLNCCDYPLSKIQGKWSGHPGWPPWSSPKLESHLKLKRNPFRVLLNGKRSSVARNAAAIVTGINSFAESLMPRGRCALPRMTTGTAIVLKPNSDCVA